MSTLKALPRRKIRDQAAAQIKELIASEQLSPGDRLPTETELAETKRPADEKGAPEGEVAKTDKQRRIGNGNKKENRERREG